MRKLRQAIPNFLVNYTWHLPKAVLANLWYGMPARKLRVIGVTGTDGKTTTVHMIYEILRAASKKVSLVSTINAEIGGASFDTGFHVTSPEPWALQKFFRQAGLAGDEFMVLEVTSHGLDQFRVWGINFEIGVITNITHEHLDYHGDMKSYIKAKAKLIKKVKYAILNRDDPGFEILSKSTAGKIITFGLRGEPSYNPTNFPLQLKLTEEYNLGNALTAAASTEVLGIDQDVIKKTLENFAGLPGRMEEIANDRGIKIIIDFAHTPHALKVALSALRVKTKNRLIAVFGAAGGRDKTKRPMMGKIASELADLIVLTDEDPRFEIPMEIINQIAQGAYEGRAHDEKNLFKIPDRAAAIKFAIQMAKVGDTIGIFGKGHEQSMNYQGVERPWSDRKAVLEALGR